MPSNRIHSTLRLFALFFAGLLLPALCRAENCPMLNAATAGGLLSGEVTMEVTHPALSDTTCTFVLKTDPATRLEIVMHTMATVGDEFPPILADCGPSSTPLRAIGNEAVGCVKNGGSGQVTEEIVSRVRERSFILRWTMPKPASNPHSEEDIRERFDNIGEMVAGSLF